MTQGLSPGVYVQEESAKVRQIQGVATSVIGALGVTERGPIGTPTRATSWSAWTKIFGGFLSNSDLPQAVFAAFLNGATEIVTVRTVHYTDNTNPLSSTAVKASGSLLNAGAGSANAVVYGRAVAPFELANGQTLIFDVDGVIQPTATLAGTVASLVSDNSETQDMSINGGNNDLDIEIDGGDAQTVNFVSGDFAVAGTATAEEMAAVINGQITGGFARDNGAGKLEIVSDTAGSGSQVAVTGGTAQAVWGFSASPATGTGNVANLAAVTIAEIKALVEAVANGITVSDDGLGRIKVIRDEAGTTKTLQVDASSTADTPLLLDNVLHVGLDAAGGVGASSGTVSGPFALVHGDTLDVAIDGAGATTTTFNGVKAALECSNAEAYLFAGGETLTFKINQGNTQTVTAGGAHTTAEQVVEDFNDQVPGLRFKLSSGGTKITIESDRGGTGSYVQVTGGTANAILGFDTGLVQGSGNVASIGAVTYAEVKSLVEALTAGVRVTETTGNKLVISRTDPGVTKTVNVSGGTALAKFGFTAGANAGTTGTPSSTAVTEGKTEGTYANNLTLRVSAATSGKADEFNLSILESGTFQEVFRNLTMGVYDGITLPTDTKYAIDVINNTDNGSSLIALTDSLIVGTASQRRPANADYTMSSGDDGLTGLVDADYLGDEAGQTGLYAFDIIDDLSLLIVPGKATSAIQNGMITYAEVTRGGSMFVILDPPTGNTPDQAIAYVETVANLKDATEYAAFYYPEVKVSNPSTLIFGNGATITIPPSGTLAGMYVRTDRARRGGIYTQPAGIERGLMRGVIGLATDTTRDEKVRDKLYPANINPIWAGTGIPYHADGSANLKRTANFTSIAERRGVIFIEQSLKRGLLFAKHANNDDALREQLKRTVTTFLLEQMKAGAFASKNPQTAFFVDTGPSINPPSEQLARRVNVQIGLATARPAEFIVLLISQDMRALEEELASLGV